jgi:hypothetical protein
MDERCDWRCVGIRKHPVIPSASLNSRPATAGSEKFGAPAIIQLWLMLGRIGQGIECFVNVGAQIWSAAAKGFPAGVRNVIAFGDFAAGSARFKLLPSRLI